MSLVAFFNNNQFVLFADSNLPYSFFNRDDQILS